jgi:2-keto-3-deoxy-6-phosphogluconate aldolase
MTMRRTQGDVDSTTRIFAIRIAVESLDYSYEELVTALVAPGVNPHEVTPSKPDMVQAIRAAVREATTPETTSGEVLSAIGAILQGAGSTIVQDEREERNRGTA